MVKEEIGMGIISDPLCLLVDITTCSVHCEGASPQDGTVFSGGSVIFRWLGHITEVSRYRPCLSKGVLDTGAIYRGWERSDMTLVNPGTSVNRST